METSKRVCLTPPSSVRLRTVNATSARKKAEAQVLLLEAQLNELESALENHADIYDQQIKAVQQLEGAIDAARREVKTERERTKYRRTEETLRSIIQRIEVWHESVPQEGPLPKGVTRKGTIPVRVRITPTAGDAIEIDRAYHENKSSRARSPDKD